MLKTCLYSFLKINFIFKSHSGFFTQNRVNWQHCNRFGYFQSPKTIQTFRSLFSSSNKCACRISVWNSLGQSRPTLYRLNYWVWHGTSQQCQPTTDHIITAQTTIQMISSKLGWIHDLGEINWLPCTRSDPKKWDCILYFFLILTNENEAVKTEHSHWSK